MFSVLRTRATHEARTFPGPSSRPPKPPRDSNAYYCYVPRGNPGLTLTFLQMAFPWILFTFKWRRFVEKESSIQMSWSGVSTWDNVPMGHIIKLVKSKYAPTTAHYVDHCCSNLRVSLFYPLWVSFTSLDPPTLESAANVLLFLLIALCYPR